MPVPGEYDPSREREPRQDQKRQTSAACRCPGWPYVRLDTGDKASERAEVLTPLCDVHGRGYFAPEHLVARAP